MKNTQRSYWVALGWTISCLPAFAQAPQSAAPPAPTQVAAPQNAAPPAPAQAPAANAVAATVNGQPVPETAVQRSLQRVPPAQHAEARPQIVNFLVDQVLVDQYILQQRIAADPKEIDKAVDEMKTELRKENKEFAKMLQEMRITEVELREHIAADIRWGKFTEQQATDKVLKDLFESQKSMFDGSMVHARHILITAAAADAAAQDRAMAQLQAIKQEINKQVADGLAKLPPGTDNLTVEKKRQSLLDDAFAAEAKAKSACPSGKAGGGDVGWFQRVGKMVEPFSQAAFALKPYEISDVVKTPFGYHLLLVTERKPGREVKFEEVKELVKDHYVTRLHESIIGAARKNAKIIVTPAK